jgi:trehalose/maltose hydrolase-like predicted phosphorylase
LKQSQQLDKDNKELAKQYLDNKAMHYAKIVEETNNYWKSYYKDCFIAAEKECLSKSGNSS